MRMTSRLWFPIMVVSMAVSAGCAHKRPEARAEARAEAREERRERAMEPRGDWVKLGERWVDGAHDRDVIQVGAREGRFRKIRIVVENSALEMYDVVVIFGDGTPFSPHTRHVFNPNTRSHVIDLPGSDRVIRSVEFRYGNLPGGGRALAEVWAS
ncbi:MAG TPA: hypothetical protein VFH73_12700 [Polyangia bacterium]|nr:hypothetical protein [Polyangia bacterium]